MEAELPASFDVQISGDVQAQQVAIGNNILQIGSIHGGVLNVLQPGSMPQMRRNQEPVTILPRRVRRFKDREIELAQAQEALYPPDPQHLDIYGDPQSGKSTFLRYLAHNISWQPASNDGLLYLRTAGKTVEDIIQFIFDAHYTFDSPIPVKPTAAQLDQALQSIQAYVLLDDFDLSWHDLDELLDHVPQSLFTLTSSRSLQLDSDFALIHLAPLDERQVTPTVVHSLSPEEKRVLLTMAAFGGRPITVERLNRLTEISDTLPLLQNLERQERVVALNDGRFRLPNNMAAALAAGPVLSGLANEDTPLDPIRRQVLSELSREQGAFSLADWDICQYLLAWSQESGFFPEEVLNLGKRVQAALAISKQWGAWEEVLRFGLHAAQQLRDVAAEGWYRHQLGTCLFLLGLALPTALQSGDLAQEAVNQLEEALRLRQSLPDYTGAAVTRYQLNYIRGIWTGADLTQESAESGRQALGRPLALVAGMVLIALILAFFQQVSPPDWVGGGATPPSGIAVIGSPTPTGVATSTATLPSGDRQEPTQTATPSPSQTPTPSSTPTSTPTFTPTPTPCFINPLANWVRTTIKPGDTLSGLANRHGNSIAQIMDVNCLIDDRINAGDQLYLPALLDLQVRSITIGSGGVADVFVSEPNSIPVPIEIELDNLGNVVANSDKLRVEYGVASGELRPARLDGVTFGQIPVGRSATLNGVIRLDPGVFTTFSEMVNVRVTANNSQDDSFKLNLSFPPLTVNAHVEVVDISGTSKPVLYREGDTYRLDLMLTAEVTPPPGYEIKSWSWIKPEGGLTVGDNERPNLNYSLEPLVRDECVEYSIEISLNVILMYHGVEGGETAPSGSSTEIISSTCS